MNVKDFFFVRLGRSNEKLKRLLGTLKQFPVLNKLAKPIFLDIITPSINRIFDFFLLFFYNFL